MTRDPRRDPGRRRSAAHPELEPPRPRPPRRRFGRSDALIWAVAIALGLLLSFLPTAAWLAQAIADAVVAAAKFIANLL